MKSLLFSLSILFVSFSGAQIKKDMPRSIPSTNKVEEATLQTTYSNDSDASIANKTTLFLSDYDKKNNMAVLEATGDRAKPGSQEYIPYIKEKCDGGSCGMAATSDTLAAVTLDKANEALKKKSSASSIDKTLFKDGSVWIVQSETPDGATGKKWHVTFAVELKNFTKNAKHVVLKYKVLEFVSK